MISPPPPASRAGAGSEEAYVVIWEYRVKRECEGEFLEIYGPGGAWELVFRESAGYVGTDLWRHPSRELTYLTIDRWQSRAAYETFRRDREEAYRALDRRCDRLTERETRLGSFERASDS